MLGSMEIGETKLATLRRVGARLGTLCGVFGLLFACLGAQCFGPQPPTVVTCTADNAATECDDDDACTTDTCVIAADATDGECDNTAACEDDHCTDAGCVACIAADECDDSVDCTTDACGADGTCSSTADNAACDDTDECTDDSCDAATGCVNTDIDCADTVACTDDGCDAGVCTHTDNCAVGSACNEDTGLCVLACDSADVCDDLDDCTDDACVNLACSNTAVDCDDGVACTDDACDAGVCGNTDNCTAPETCDTATGLCEAVPDCVDDAGCDDGVFCNGAETCDVDTGDCVAGTRPCDDNNDDACPPDGEATETCAEGDAAAVCTACPPITLDLTLSQDNLTGTTGNDVFSAALLFNAPSGTQVASLQTGDSANGLAGADILNATLGTPATNPVPTTLAGIETMNFTDFGGNTISAGGVSGVDTINSVNSTATLTVTALQELADFGMSGITNAAVGLNLTFGTAATTTGATDTITGTLTSSTVGTVNITTAAGTTNGFETVGLVSSGTAANTLTTLTQTTGTTMATLNISGAQALTANTVPNTIRTINGSTATGALTLGTGTTVATYATINTANLVAVTGGTGNDTLILANTLDSNDFTSGTCDLGAGTDVVQLSFGADFLSASPFRNTEEARLNATAAAAVNFNGHTGLTTLTNEADGTAHALTFQNVPATANVFPTLNFRGNNGTGANQTFDTVTYNAVGNTGSSDSLTVALGNRGTAINSGTATTFSFAAGGGATVTPGFETVSITCSDGPCTFSGLTATTLVTLNVTGSSNVTLGTVDATASTVLAVNASNVIGNFSATVDDIATGANVTLGVGNDTFTIGAGSTGTSTFNTLGGGNDTFIGDTNTASADTVSAGDGSDNINGGLGIDTVTTGNGSDIVVYDIVPAAANAKSVTDFTSGAGGDILRFDISALALASAGAEDSGAIAGLSVNDDIFILTGAGHATDAAAETALAADDDAAGTIVYIYFNTTDSSTHILYDPIAETDTPSAVLLGRLTNITTQAAHDLITTAANVDSQP